MNLEYKYNWILPLWIPLVGLIVGLLALWGLARLLELLTPATSAVASATAKESRSQPLFPAVMGLGFVFVVAALFLPYGTFGDDTKMMKDTGLMMILVLSIILAVCSASVSIADEVDGRTALTVLSKPVTRRQFIIGKLLGVLTPVAIFYVVLGSFFLATISFKTKYEARENSLPPPPASQCQAEMVQTFPALVLAFMETVVLTSISVAVSTRLPMMPNLLICAVIYVVGHMTPLLVQSSVGKLPIVAFVGQFLSTLLPVLEHYNIQAAIASGRETALGIADWAVYLGWAGAYCLLYSTIMLLVSLLLFEDRDLA